MSSAIDGRSLPPELQARYGTGRPSRLPLVAGIIAVHVWGGKRASSYETESFI